MTKESKSQDSPDKAKEPKEIQLPLWTVNSYLKKHGMEKCGRCGADVSGVTQTDTEFVPLFTLTGKELNTNRDMNTPTLIMVACKACGKHEFFSPTPIIPWANHVSSQLREINGLLKKVIGTPPPKDFDQDAFEKFLDEFDKSFADQPRDLKSYFSEAINRLKGVHNNE